MPTYTQYMDGLLGATADTGAGPSESIWGDCPTLEMIHNPGVGYHFFDDFIVTGPTGTVGAIADWGTYAIFGSSGATITNADTAGGEIVLTEATDGESVSLYSESHPFSITAGAGKLWFEARIKTADIVTLANTFFVGLIDTTAITAIVPLTASGTLADANLVGFFQPEADTTTFDSVYKADGVDAVTVNDGLATLAANTYVKVGMVFDPNGGRTGTANQLSFYINGVRQATSKTIPDATGTDFPADITMGLCASLAVGAGAATDTLTMDWWRCAQLR